LLMPRPAALGRGAAFASGRSLATNSRAWDDVLDHMAPVDRGDGDRGVVLVGVAQSPVLPRQWRRDGFSISTDPKYFDLAVIHGYLVRSSWAEGIPVEIVQRSLEHSLGFALFEGEPGGRQVGFARVTTDFATFGYLADVFVLETYRGRGLGQWICERE